MAIPTKPKLLFQVTIKRALFMRRFMWSLLATVAALGAAGALNAAAERGIADSGLLAIGVAAGLLAAVLFGLRGLFNLWLWLRRRNETVRIFDRGLVWTRTKDEWKYGWSQLDIYRDNGHGLYLGKRVIAQWGAQSLTMTDGRAFKITGAYGDLRQIGAILRRYAAHYTGIRMGRMLREEQPVKLHHQLTVWPGGVEIGKTEIPWSDMDVRLQNRRLAILKKSESGKFKPFRQFNTSSVNNVGGFMELATTTIRNHQRERFEKKSKVT